MDILFIYPAESEGFEPPSTSATSLPLILLGSYVNKFVTFT